METKTCAQRQEVIKIPFALSLWVQDSVTDKRMIKLVIIIIANYCTMMVALKIARPLKKVALA